MIKHYEFAIRKKKSSCFMIACANAYFTGLVLFTRQDNVLHGYAESINKLNHSKIQYSGQVGIQHHTNINVSDNNKDCIKLLQLQRRALAATRRKIVTYMNSKAGKVKPKMTAARGKYWQRDKGLQPSHFDWTPKIGF